MPSRRNASTRPPSAAGVVWLVAAAVAAAGCHGRARRTPDDTLVVIVDQKMGTSDPRYALSNADTKLSRLVAVGLTTVDTPTMEPAPALALSIDRVDDLTFDATLRPGLRFSDGNPVTAADVAWTYMSAIARGSDAPTHKQLAERFRLVEPIGPETVRFHLNAPLATLMSDLDFGILERAAAGPDGHFAGGVVVGCGPYRLVDLDERGARLVRADTWTGAHPPVPKLELRVVTDASARILMLVGGSADLSQNGVRLDLLDDVAAEARVRVEHGPSAILTYLMMNNDDPVLRDRRVRQAIALAIDREAILKTMLGGRAVLATGLLPPSHWAYDGDVPRWTHDPARAERLLEAAGYHDPDGPGPAPRVGPDGQPLRLTYKTSSDRFRVAVARVLAAQLGKVGIEVDVRSYEFATMFADVKKGAFQLASMQTSSISEPDFLFTYFHSSRIPGPGHPDDNNRWRYRNPAVDALTQLGRLQLDRDARKRTYGQVQRILATDLPIIPLWHEDNVVVANRDVGGFAIYPDARMWGLVTTAKRARR